MVKQIGTRDITRIFPIQIDGSLEMRLMDNESWFASCMLSDWYYRHMNSRCTNTKKELTDILKEMKEYYYSEDIDNNKEEYEVRYIIYRETYSSSEAIGGGSVYFDNTTRQMKLSYFTTPNNQNKGVATRALRAMVKELESKFRNQAVTIVLKIKSTNEKSKAVADNAEFKKIEPYRGSDILYYCKNI